MVSVCQAINRLCRKKYRVDKYSDYVYLRRLQPTDQHWTVTTRVVLSVVSHSDIPLVAKMSHFSSKMNRKLIVNELFTYNKQLNLLHILCKAQLYVDISSNSIMKEVSFEKESFKVKGVGMSHQGVGGTYIHRNTQIR